MNKPTIADILHYAADHCLMTAQEFKDLPYPTVADKQLHTCFAISKAAYDLTSKTEFPDHDWVCNSARQWYKRSFGMPYAFLPPTMSLKEAQEIRYATLKFAALIAEEEGV